MPNFVSWCFSHWQKASSHEKTRGFAHARKISWRSRHKNKPPILKRYWYESRFIRVYLKDIQSYQCLFWIKIDCFNHLLVAKLLTSCFLFASESVSEPKVSAKTIWSCNQMSETNASQVLPKFTLRTLLHNKAASLILQFYSPIHINIFIGMYLRNWRFNTIVG